MRILVTGGFGFIGSHLVDALIERGFETVILDNLERQVHGGRLPAHANREAEAVIADVRDKDALRRALQGVDAVFHLAAMVGVGQSMYEVARYVSVNCQGTANLLDILANEAHGVRKLVVASSMSVYGEGEYLCPQCGGGRAAPRGPDQLGRRDWEARCADCSAELLPLPTREDKPLRPGSIYSVSKKDQEELSLVFGQAFAIPTVALRFFNAYGPRQSLSNPYTGVCAIFCSRHKNGEPPLIFEDGQQLRDFVHVSDVAQACLLALENPDMDHQAFNVGSGQPISILELARTIQQAAGSPIPAEVTGRFRVGDVRHCFADISRLRAMGFAPRVAIEDGMGELMEWMRGETAEDHFPAALRQLERYKLVG